MTTTAEKVKACKFCEQPVRFVEVVIGARQDRRVLELPIDAEPNAGGRVVERDGVYRLLSGQKVAQPGESTFRLHGKSNCGPGSRR